VFSILTLGKHFLLSHFEQTAADLFIMFTHNGEVEDAFGAQKRPDSNSIGICRVRLHTRIELSMREHHAVIASCNTRRG
jgi:hypothetical protein